MHSSQPLRLFRRRISGTTGVLGAGTLGMAAFAMLATGASAQTGPGDKSRQLATVSQPVVQAVPANTPANKGMQLNEALGRLARNPQDVAALIDAGRTSLVIGDVDAAIGFYQRADQLSPGNARVKAGLAGAYVQSGDAITALPLFDEAEKQGRIEPALLADRGLAYDLVGDNATAQRYYREALAAGPNEEATRRLGLSQAIAGDRRGMEITLSPMLQGFDMGAWRTRAFGFAILGIPDEAESITRQVMPPQEAAQMSAYLRYMPRLTAAQQAAAANLGRFPRAAEIGRDDPRLAALSRSRTTLASAEQSLTPAGAPLGAKDQKSQKNQKARDRKDQKAGTRKGGESRTPDAVLAAATPPPARTPAPPAAPLPSRTNTAVPAPAPTPAPAPVAQPKPAVAVAAPVAGPVAAPAATSPGFTSLDATVGRQGGGFDLRQVTLPSAAPPAAPPAAPSPAPQPVAATPAVQPERAPPVVTPPPAPKPRNLADVFADLTPPSRAIEPKSGAVDVRRVVGAPAVKDGARDSKGRLIAVDDPKGRDAKVDAKGDVKGRDSKGSATARQPSRIWVQLATGRDKAALAYDYRKMTREDADVLRDRKGFTSPWGQATRLLIGPFDSQKAADALLARVRKAGISGAFVWTSPAGQVVDPLAAR